MPRPIETSNGSVPRNHANPAATMRPTIGKGAISRIGNPSREAFRSDSSCNSYHGLHVFNILLSRSGFDTLFRFKTIQVWKKSLASK